MRALWFTAGALLGGGAVYVGLRKLAPLLSGVPSGVDLQSALGVHVRQIRRYAFASSQDQSPIVGITHASYALVLLDTLEEIVGRDAIKRAGYDPAKLRKFITEQQDRHAKMLEGRDPFLQRVLAIERAEAPDAAPGAVTDAWAAPRGA